MTDSPLTIGEVASRYDVTLRTLRFYEAKGLLAPERRGTARLYDAAQIARLEAILERRRLGFAVPAIAAVIARHGVPLPRLTRAEVDAQIAHLEAQHAIIVAAIAELRAMLARLEVRSSGPTDPSAGHPAGVSPARPGAAPAPTRTRRSRGRDR